MAERASEPREPPPSLRPSSSGAAPRFCSRCCSSARWRNSTSAAALPSLLCDERKGRLGVGALAFCGIARCLPLLASSLSVRRLHRIDPLVLTCRRSALVALWLLLGALPHVGASEELSPSAPPSLPPAAPEAADRSGFLITLGAIGAAVFGALIVFLPVAPILLAELPARKVSGCGTAPGARESSGRPVSEPYDVEGGGTLLLKARPCARGVGQQATAGQQHNNRPGEGRRNRRERGACEGSQDRVRRDRREGRPREASPAGVECRDRTEERRQSDGSQDGRARRDRRERRQCGESPPDGGGRRERREKRLGDQAHGEGSTSRRVARQRRAVPEETGHGGEQNHEAEATPRVAQRAEAPCAERTNAAPARSRAAPLKGEGYCETERCEAEAVGPVRSRPFHPPEDAACPSRRYAERLARRYGDQRGACKLPPLHGAGVPDTRLDSIRVNVVNRLAEREPEAC
mmetsp:Transcript_17357/g.41536  ORF Transcript_17357/g.41536 Transcript_17357/m.41536 type:complete len:463 (-) Transcript_17357:590-1978(-)